MMVPFLIFDARRLCSNKDHVGDNSGQINHKDPKVVTKIIRLQHRSSRAVNIDFCKEVGVTDRR